MQLPASLVGSSLIRLAEELPGALRCGDQQGTLHARKLTTCIQASKQARTHVGGWVEPCVGVLPSLSAVCVPCMSMGWVSLGVLSVCVSVCVSGW